MSRDLKRMSQTQRQKIPNRKNRSDWMKWLIPLALIGPAFKIGQYAVGTTDLSIIVLGIVGIVSGRKISTTGSPIVPYFALFLVGWFVATANGPAFGVNFQTGDLVILYRLLFCFLAWQIGYWSKASLERVSTSRFAILMILAAVAIAILFAFLSFDQRVKLISYFQPIRDSTVRGCANGRFPGVNEQVNIYSFLPLCLLVFSFRAYMTRQASFFVPMLAVILIVALGSRTTMVSAVFAIAVIYFYPMASSLDSKGMMRWTGVRLRNRLLIAIMMMAAGLVVSGLLTQGAISSRGMDKMTAEDSEADIIHRFVKWEQGMKRVAMSPLLGIPEPKGDEREELSYYLRMTRPHNEFVQIWMWYGLLGLIAHVYLLYVLLQSNVRMKTGVVWYLFYFAVIVRMCMVTNFKSYHFSAIFFMVAGYNWQLIEVKRRALVQKRRKMRSRRRRQSVEEMI